MIHPAKSRQGSAVLELVAMTPIVAAFVLVAAQLAVTLAKSVHDVARAESDAIAALRAWDESHAGKGFSRPCIEQMQGLEFSRGGEPSTVGAGRFAKPIAVPQEVRVAVEPICIP